MDWGGEGRGGEGRTTSISDGLHTNQILDLEEWSTMHNLVLYGYTVGTVRPIFRT